jgi:fructokinase
MRVLSIGEVLWDVFPDLGQVKGQEHLGGAPLNFSANIVRLGGQASLLTGIGHDQRGRIAQETMVLLGVGTDFVQTVEDCATGVARVSTSASGEPQFSIPRPAAFDLTHIPAETMERLHAFRPDWLYFGTLTQTEQPAEDLVRQLAATLPGVRCFYDMNLRPNCWNLALVQRLCGLATVLKLNEHEAATLGEMTGMGTESFTLEAFCEVWAAQYELAAICVTLGPQGCLVFQDGAFTTVPGYPAVVQDTVGAGDAFSAAFLHGFHHLWPVLQTARFANALGSLVASRAGATPPWTVEEVRQIANLPADRVAVK